MAQAQKPRATRCRNTSAATADVASGASAVITAACWLVSVRKAQARLSG